MRIFQVFLSTRYVQLFYNKFNHFDIPLASPENLINELLNDICAVDYIEKDGEIIWIARWDGLEFSKEKSLPDVTVIAVKSADGLILDCIKIKFREESQEHLIHPTEEKIKWALYVARSVFCLKGEVEIHLAEGHLLPGIVAKSFFKHIKPSNPIYGPAAPHLSQLDFINWIGVHGLIFGKGSVIETSALTENSTAKIILDYMTKKANYTEEGIQEPINKNHFRLIAAKTHYKMLYDFFVTFIDKNIEEIEKHKKEIYQWSKSMNNKFSHIPLIMESDAIFNQTEQIKLAQCLASFINKTTFLHWTAHSQQVLLSDISAASISMRNFGLDSKGQLDPYGNTPPLEASLQLATVGTLLRFKADLFLENPYGDMNLELLQIFKEKMKDYPAYYPIKDMHITTQI